MTLEIYVGDSFRSTEPTSNADFCDFCGEVLLELPIIDRKIQFYT